MKYTYATSAILLCLALAERPGDGPRDCGGEFDLADVAQDPLIPTDAVVEHSPRASNVAGADPLSLLARAGNRDPEAHRAFFAAASFASRPSSCLVSAAA